MGRVLCFMMVFMAVSFCACKDEKLCDNTCPFANDGVCDDGGEGSAGHVCQFGADCNDCGERTAPK